jgi:hypothetical protein
VQGWAQDRRDKVERQRQARWFADAKAGLNHELERTLGSRPPQDWKGHAYEWFHLEGQDERTAFYAAAVDGQLHTVKLLAERGTNVLDVDLANETALHAAACNGHIEVMRWLVEHRVPIDAQSISISRSTCSATARQCVQRTRRRRRPSPMHRGP